MNNNKSTSFNFVRHYKRKCVICGKDFVGKVSNQKCCGADKCKAAFKEMAKQKRRDYSNVWNNKHRAESKNMRTIEREQAAAKGVRIMGGGEAPEFPTMRVLNQYVARYGTALRPDYCSASKWRSYLAYRRDPKRYACAEPTNLTRIIYRY